MFDCALYDIICLYNTLEWRHISSRRAFNQSSKCADKIPSRTPDTREHTHVTQSVDLIRSKISGTAQHTNCVFESHAESFPYLAKLCHSNHIRGLAARMKMIGAQSVYTSETGFPHSQIILKNWMLPKNRLLDTQSIAARK